MRWATKTCLVLKPPGLFLWKQLASFICYLLLLAVIYVFFMTFMRFCLLHKMVPGNS